MLQEVLAEWGHSSPAPGSADGEDLQHLELSCTGG